jgi:PAP2 superfamily
MKRKYAQGMRKLRFSGRREVAIGLGVYAVYLLASRPKRGDSGRRRAARNAERVVALERRLGIHVEPRLQQLLLPRRRLLAVLNVAYVTLNVGLTVGWLMRLYRHRHPEFHRLRRAAVLTTLGAQPVFVLFPCAPPRTQEGFVDTIGEVSGVDLDKGLVAQLYDPLAAMPSIHLAYAVVTAFGLATASKSPLVRVLAPGYPPLVALIVFATANHYVLDAVAGALLGAAGLRLARAFG